MFFFTTKSNMMVNTRRSHESAPVRLDETSLASPQALGVAASQGVMGSYSQRFNLNQKPCNIQSVAEGKRFNHEISESHRGIMQTLGANAASEFLRVMTPKVDDVTYRRLTYEQAMEHMRAAVKQLVEQVTGQRVQPTHSSPAQLSESVYHEPVSYFNQQPIR